MVQEVIGWYKRYRDIINSDIIHLRKPDARDWDGIMHVNPNLKEKALAMLFNPTDADIVRTVRLPLYYTGLQRKVRVREQEGKAKTYRLTGRPRGGTHRAHPRPWLHVVCGGVVAQSSTDPRTEYSEKVFL